MILRRVTKHVKDQNWFAVGLDFLIVVAGILIAFQITNWSSARQKNADLKRAEISIQKDLMSNYYNAQERMTVVECRKNRVRELSDRLLEPGDDWEAAPFQRADKKPRAGTRAIDSVIPSSSRIWGSTVWDTEFPRGTFSLIDADRRETLNMLFSEAKYIEALQDEVHTLEARLDVLSRTTTISRSDRLKYFDILSELDKKSVTIESSSKDVAADIEYVGIERLDEQERLARISNLESSNQRRKDIYGDCVKPIELFFLDAPDERAAP